MLSSPFLAAKRVFFFVMLTLVCAPLQAVLRRFKGSAKRHLPRWYHSKVLKCLGITVQVRGKRSTAQPTLFVSNHISYWDIPVLGSLLIGSFVAKAEIADWPFFGWLAKLQNSVFVDRRRSKTAEHRDDMSTRLEKGENLIIFAEGTSGDGNRVLPFKSALLSVAQERPGGRPLVVQPVSICYRLLDDIPMGRYLRPYFAWYGDMELAGHMWEGIGLGNLTIEVIFHEPVTIDQLGGRKQLANYCYERVAEGVASGLTGQRLQIAKPSQSLNTQAA